MVLLKDRSLRLCTQYLANIERSLPQSLNAQDWDSFLKTASHHSIGPLLYHNLAISKRRIPPAVIEQLKKQYYLNAIRNELFYKELGVILEAFEEAEVKAIVLKGAALAETVYQERGLRPFGDIDLLIRKEDLNNAGETLTGLGYILDTYATPRGFSEKFDYHMRYSKGAVIVELHWELGLKASIYKYMNIKIDDFRKDARRSKIAGKDVLIPSPENLIVHSCIHSAKHKYSRLIWLCDLRQITERQKINWESLISTSKSSRIERAVFYGLSFADELPGIVLPGYVQDELKPPASEIRLFRFFINRDSSGILDIAKDMFLRLLLIDRTIDRLKFLATYPAESLAYLLCGGKKRTLRRLREGTAGL